MNYSHKNTLLKDILRAALMTAIAVTFVLIPRVARAHAVLLQSSPAINATVQGPELKVAMKFNSRVDGPRSTLLLGTVQGDSKPLVVEKQTSPDTLVAHATKLMPGKYIIHWQVLAVDGHITRGQIPFDIK